VTDPTNPCAEYAAALLVLEHAKAQLAGQGRDLRALVDSQRVELALVRSQRDAALGREAAAGREVARYAAGAIGGS
jgi:hypothetical protein